MVDALAVEPAADAADMADAAPLIAESLSLDDAAALAERLAADGPGGAERFRCLIARRGGAVVGVATYGPVYDPGSGGAGLAITLIHVVEAVRRQGVGRALMAALAAEACALSPDGPWLDWRVDRLDLDARTFFDILFPDGFRLNSLSYRAEGPALGALAAQAGGG